MGFKTFKNIFTVLFSLVACVGFLFLVGLSLVVVSRGDSRVAVLGFLFVLVSPVADHGLEHELSSCGEGS